MEARKAETLYLERRVSDSLALAAAAAGPCAQIAHLTLARLYGEAIDALIAQPQRATFHSLFSDAAAVGRAVPGHPASGVMAKSTILAIAKDERELACALPA